MSSTDLFARAERGERAILVLPQQYGQSNPQQRMQEFTELAVSAGARVLEVLTARVQTPNPRFFIGSGKVEEIATACRALDADLVLMDHLLSPVQERNLERELKARVIDRAGLILDIFSQRARSYEGKLEVELAQLRHLSTRLVRGWTHLERQRGGSIGLRGPGETQLETDRRLLGIRVKQLSKRLEKVQKQRNQQRQRRLRNNTSRVALVGYTNAGKSSLFNQLTGDRAYAADQLFATLDPTVRQIDDLQTGSAVIADTVGFVRDLPHTLVAAFRATLTEARDADLLLHVSDASDDEAGALRTVVNAVLKEIGADDIPQLHVENKIDLTAHEPHVDYDADGTPRRVWVSAQTGAGLPLLRQALDQRLSGTVIDAHLDLPLTCGRVYGVLQDLDAVLDEYVDADGWHLHIRAPAQVLASVSGRDAQRVRDLVKTGEDGE